MSRRGSLFGNLCSWRMERLLATIRLETRDATEITLKVDSRLQDLSETNQSVFALELWTVNELAAMSGETAPRSDAIAEAWDLLGRTSRKKGANWLLSLTLSGRTLEPSWDRLLSVIIPGWRPEGPLNGVAPWRDNTLGLK